MKKRTKCLLISLIIVSILWIVSVSIYYACHGFSISLHPIQNNAINSFVALINMVIIPIINILVCYFYYQTLTAQHEEIKQQKEIAIYNDLNNLIKTWRKTFERTEITTQMLDKNRNVVEQKKFRGYESFKKLNEIIKILESAFENNVVVKDFELEYETFTEKYNECLNNKILEHEDKEEYEKQLNDCINRMNEITMIHQFGVKYKSEHSAIEYVVNYYHCNIEIYMQELSFIIKYLQQLSSDNVATYKDYVKSHITSEEKKFLSTYIQRPSNMQNGIIWLLDINDNKQK